MQEDNQGHHTGDPSEDRGLVTLFSGDTDDVNLLSLVLTSRAIPHSITYFSKHQAEILVESSYSSFAQREIELFNEENKGFFKDSTKKHWHFRYLKASLLSIVLVSCLMSLTFRYELSQRLLDIGAADSYKILHGQFWRTVTCLFLHADPSHFLSNMVMAALFFSILFEETGIGAGWFAVLAGGAVGNFLNALMYKYDHVSIGLSTAIFSSIGTYCSLKAMTYGFSGARDGFKVLLSGLALLGLLGTGEGRVDISAHFFGFLCGLGIGVLFWIMRKMCGVCLKRLDPLFALAAILMVVASWTLAWLSGSG